MTDELKPDWTNEEVEKIGKEIMPYFLHHLPKDDKMTDENKNGETPAGPFREDGPLAAPMVEILHPELATDPEAAKHGARRFAMRFSDAEVQKALDRTAVPGSSWCVSVSAIVPGDVGDNGQPVIRHFFKTAERFPILDIPNCVAAMAEYAFGRIPLEQVGETSRQLSAEVSERAGKVFRDRQKRAEIGFFVTANEAPETFADQED